jgi:oxygen-independent coproporphyrinogen-3 oxidase
MALGVYIHVPYCLQKCHYCDFTTFALDHEVSMQQYTQVLLQEIRNRANDITDKSVCSLYFGGGTPSLLPAQDILTIRNALANAGFQIDPDAEITIEINPGTITEDKLALYLETGINRFSVGVQTFNEKFLAAAGREHSATDSRNTLKFLARNRLHYSFDLLFGLPHQTIEDLNCDLQELLHFSPDHVSLYNLTVPERHFMNRHRAPEETQVEMFALIDRRLSEAGIFRYELSNFSLPGKEARHNQLYWTDQSYWGLGVSAHSYLNTEGTYGTRFWNPAYHKHYLAQAAKNKPRFWEDFPPTQREVLQAHEALTDFCHTQLRLVSGLNYEKFTKKFGSDMLPILKNKAAAPLQAELLTKTANGFAISPLGRPLANKIFLNFTFMPDDLPQTAR